MFEIGDLVWYRSVWGNELPVAAVITDDGKDITKIIRCRVTGQDQGAWGYADQFESRACHLCDSPATEPGCPLCPGCAEEQGEREEDARATAEQRRRPR